MMEGDWRSSILSTHTKALNRQVTEAVLISGGGERERGGGRPVRLLNSKQEFGANLMLEVVVMRGGEVLGQRNNKRRRGGQLREEDVTPIRVEEEGSSGRLQGTEQEEEGRPPGPTIAPPSKRRRRHQVELVEGAEEAPMNFEELSIEGLRKEMRRRRLRPGGKLKEEMVRELQREVRSQRRICWRMGGGTGPYVQGIMLRRGEEEGGGEEQEPPDPGEAGEAEWEDFQPREEDREARSDTAEEARTTSTRRGQRNTKLRCPQGRGSDRRAGGE